jgi:hypothetical protein
MNVTLYQAATELAAALDQIDPETGELPAEYGTARELVERKGAAVAAYIAQREMEADAIDGRLEEISKRVKAMRSRAAHLRSYLADCMRTAGVTEIASDDKLLRVRLYPGRDESVEVYDQSLLGEQFTRVLPCTREPDKTGIKVAIKSGQDVQGARIVKRDRLIIG